MIAICMAIKKSSKIKDQNRKGHVNLPIALSKIYTNNSSKELKTILNN